MANDMADALERLFAFGDRLTKGHEIDREALDRMLEHRPTEIPPQYRPMVEAAMREIRDE